eukprot:547767-Prymnesium_polylepis.1
MTQSDYLDWKRHENVKDGTVRTTARTLTTRGPDDTVYNSLGRISRNPAPIPLGAYRVFAVIEDRRCISVWSIIGPFLEIVIDRLIDIPAQQCLIFQRSNDCEDGCPGPTEARGGSLVDSTAQCRTKRA